MSGTEGFVTCKTFVVLEALSHVLNSAGACAHGEVLARRWQPAWTGTTLYCCEICPWAPHQVKKDVMKQVLTEDHLKECT